MKSSHFTTPRTLAECQFALNADPIERTGGAAQQRIADRVVTAACVIAIVFLAVMLFLGK